MNFRINFFVIFWLFYICINFICLFMSEISIYDHQFRRLKVITVRNNNCNFYPLITSSRIGSSLFDHFLSDHNPPWLFWATHCWILCCNASNAITWMISTRSNAVHTIDTYIDTPCFLSASTYSCNQSVLTAFGLYACWFVTSIIIYSKVLK